MRRTPFALALSLLATLTTSCGILDTCAERSADVRVGINAAGVFVDGRQLYWDRYDATCTFTGNTGGLRPMEVYRCTWCD